MHKHVVIDLETLGTKPGAVLLEIGAVAFGGPAPDLTFSVLVNNQDAETMGFHYSEETLKWWMQQPFFLPDMAASLGVDVRDALLMFLTWYQVVASEDTLVWGNSPSFDCAILEEALTLVGLAVPWSHRAERDLRTIRWLHPHIQAPVPDQPHRALSDALAEAEHLKQMLHTVGRL